MFGGLCNTCITETSVELLNINMIDAIRESEHAILWVKNIMIVSYFYPLLYLVIIRAWSL